MKEWIAVGILEGLTVIMIVISIIKMIVEERKKNRRRNGDSERVSETVVVD